MFIINASCVISLGIEVEAFRKTRICENPSLGCRERFNFSKRSELRSGSVMNLRVVEVLIVNVILDMYCHTPNPGPTRLADPNRFPGRETKYWDS